MAMLDSPARRLWHAKCIAVRLEEHAVSTVRLGPRKSKAYDIRLDIRASAHPVALNIGSVSGSRKSCTAYSENDWAAKTPIFFPVSDCNARLALQDLV